MISKYFNLEELKTNYKTEFTAGVTTFLTMSYVLILNPKLLSLAGIPFEAAFVATALTAFIGCFLMGVYAKLPFGVASYVGESAFVVYTAVKLLGYTWQEAFGAIFVCGLILFLLTLVNIRTYLVNSIPISVKLAFAAGLGLFLAFIGLTDAGIIIVSGSGCPFKIGSLYDIKVILGLFNIALIMILMSKKIKAAILIGIFTTSLLGLAFGLIQLPESLFAFPSGLEQTFAKLNISGILNLHSLPLIFVTLIIIFTDTMGTLIGASYKANLLDCNKNLPNCKKPMLVDSFSTMLASFFGTTTSGVYLESVSGIKSGGKSGLTAVIVGFLMLFGLFFEPLISIIPPFAYAGALFIVGILMLSSIKEIPLNDYTEAFPALTGILFIVFTYNIGIGIAVCFILYPILKLLCGRKNETNIAQWILCFLSVLFFIFYPY